MYLYIYSKQLERIHGRFTKASKGVSEAKRMEQFIGFCDEPLPFAKIGADPPATSMSSTLQSPSGDTSVTSDASVTPDASHVARIIASPVKTRYTCGTCHSVKRTMVTMRASHTEFKKARKVEINQLKEKTPRRYYN